MNFKNTIEDFCIKFKKKIPDKLQKVLEEDPDAYIFGDFFAKVLCDLEIESFDICSTTCHYFEKNGFSINLYTNDCFTKITYENIIINLYYNNIEKIKNFGFSGMELWYDGFNFDGNNLGFFFRKKCILKKNIYNQIIPYSLENYIKMKFDIIFYHDQI